MMLMTELWKAIMIKILKFKNNDANSDDLDRTFYYEKKKFNWSRKSCDTVKELFDFVNIFIPVGIISLLI